MIKNELNDMEDVQYQQRTDTVTDWDVFEKLPSLINVDILSLDQKHSLLIINKLISTIGSLYLLKLSYIKLLDTPDERWSSNDISIIQNQLELTDRIIVSTQEAIRTIENDRSDVLTPLLQAGRALLEAQRREEDRIRLLEWKKTRRGQIVLEHKSVLFSALKDAFLQGLEEYIARHPSPILGKFKDAICNDLRAFLRGQSTQKYSFSLSVKNGTNIEYVSFNFEESVIEVSCGGSTYDSNQGGDSYISWFYSIWNDGSEESDGVTEESFDFIRELFYDEEAIFSIDSPDELEYYDDCW